MHVVIFEIIQRIGPPAIPLLVDLLRHERDSIRRSAVNELIDLTPHTEWIVAFARTVPVDEVRSVLDGTAIRVIDTEFAVHLQSPGISKGTALRALVGELGLPLEQVMAVGDSANDLEMIQVAGIGATVANGHHSVRAAVDMVAEKKYGDGFIEAVRRYLPYFLER